MNIKKILNLNNFFLLVIFCIPTYLIKVTFFGIPSNVLELLSLLFIVLIFIKEWQTISKKIATFPRKILIALVLILLGILFSIVFNDKPLVGLGIIKGWFIIPMLFSFMLYIAIKSRQDIEKIFLSIYFSSAFVGLIAIAYKIAVFVTYDNRLTAFYLSPNHLAMYLAPGIFFGLYFLIKSFTESYSVKKILLNICLIALICIPLYYTYSYGAWLAILSSLLIMGLMTINDKKLLAKIILFFFIFTITLFSLQLNSDKFSMLTSFSSRSSFASRQTIWQASLFLIKESPFIGIGPGNFQQAYLSLQSKFPPYLEWAVPQPHNLFLAFWLQAGILGLFGFVFLLFLIFQMLWKIFKNKKDKALAISLFGFFIYTILHGLIDTTLWKNDLSYLFWVATFLVLALYRITKKTD